MAEISVSEVSPVEKARDTFTHELRPLLKTSRETTTFLRVLDVYKKTLDTAIVDKSLDDSTATAAEFVVGNLGLRKGVDAQDIEKETEAKTEAVYQWFAKHYGNADLLLSSLFNGDAETSRKLKTVIGRNLSHWIAARKSLGKVYRQDIEKREIAAMGKFLLDNAQQFQELRKEIKGDDSVSEVEALDLAEQAQEGILRLDDTVGAFESRHWIATTGKEARMGLKIYETPYYKDILEKLHFLGRKKNGVGGVILYGPPGTGKTELLQENNKQQGFKTRVVNIHHYTSFADLIAERAMQLNIDEGASFAQKAKAVLDVLEKEDPKNFGNDMTEMFLRLKVEGKLREEETLPQFLSSFITLRDEVLSKTQLSETDWAEAKEAFITRQRARLIRTILPTNLQESVEDIVRGEILLAIQNGERVVLDEIDKAGPNSLGGILSFLAKSPGESLTFGETTVTIPNWFTVDATSNSVELNEYLKDRFSHLEVTTPPAKDQLMIAAVRVSDDEGNVLISDYEQSQLVGLFTYIVPEISDLLEANNFAPFSNRNIQELTSYLVDFGSMQRTNVSFEQAVRMLLSQNKLWAKNENVASGIDKILTRFGEIIKDKPLNLQGDEKPPKKLGLRARKEETLANVDKSPLIHAIRALGEKIDPISKPTIKPLTLTDKQKAALEEHLRKMRNRPISRLDIRQLPVGFTIAADKKDGATEFRLVATAGVESAQTLLTDTAKPYGKVADISNDGKVAIIVSDLNESIEGIHAAHVFKGDKANTIDLGYAEKGVDVKITPDGSHVLIINRKKNFLVSWKTDEKENANEASATDFSMSEDGRFVLVAKPEGKTELWSSDLRRNITSLDGLWRFAGNNFILKESAEGIANGAFLII